VKFFFNRYLMIILLFVVIGEGCVVVFGNRSSVVGKLRVAGPSVLLNGKPARDGMKVYFGDHLATGPGSSAMLDFTSGGYLQLDENTDPMFTWFEEAKCILIRMVYGQAYLAKGKVCVEGPNINLVLNSEANLHLRGDLTQLTLLRGSATVSRPRALQITPGQLLTARGEKLVGVRNLSPSELAAIISWRRKYKFKPYDLDNAAPMIFLPPVRRTVPSTRTGTSDTPSSPIIREKIPNINTTR